MRAGRSGLIFGALLSTVVPLTEALDLFQPLGTVISAILVTGFMHAVFPQAMLPLAMDPPP
jgi:hypothetical protein